MCRELSSTVVADIERAYSFECRQHQAIVEIVAAQLVVPALKADNASVVPRKAANEIWPASQRSESFLTPDIEAGHPLLPDGLEFFRKNSAEEIIQSILICLDA